MADQERLDFDIFFIMSLLWDCYLGQVTEFNSTLRKTSKTAYFSIFSGGFRNSSVTSNVERPRQASDDENKQC